MAIVTSLPRPVTMSRSDWILAAFTQYVEANRALLDNDETLQKVLVQINLQAGGGHPRGIRCQLEQETPFVVPKFDLTHIRSD